MVGNWRQRKESGVDTKEGVIKVSVLKAVLFLWRVFKPPGNALLHTLKGGCGSVTVLMVGSS